MELWLPHGGGRQAREPPWFNCDIALEVKDRTEAGGYDPSACKRLWRKFEAIDS